MNSTLKKILVPIDFSEQSLIALNQSYNLARHFNAEITLLYVIEELDIISKIFSKHADETIKKTIQEKLDVLVAETEKKSKVTVTSLIAKGAVYEKIVELAEVLNATFIIMGCTNKKKFIGSNALRVVREANCAVITIHGKQHRDGCKNIVLPLDLTKETKEKVSKAIELAKSGTGAAIRIVSVLFTTDEFIVNKLTRQLTQVKHFIESMDIVCTAEIIKSTKGHESLAHSILDYANKVEADLIMIMTQQEVDFTKYFIGSAAQEIINNSNIPVMSIIPSIKKDTSSFTPY